MAETSCNQLLLIEFATFMLKINLPVINSIAVSLYNIIGLGGSQIITDWRITKHSKEKKMCYGTKKQKTNLAGYTLVTWF